MAFSSWFQGDWRRRWQAVRQWVWRDSYRLSLQTVVAVVLAYGVTVAFRLPDLSWAAFSALFVVRGTLDGTLWEAASRVTGAVAGALLGVALLAWLGTMWPQVAIMALGVGLMSLLVIRWPSLSYGLVTVAILTVAPEPDALGGAWDKVLAIITGSVSGVLASVIVLPSSARRRARHKLAESVEQLGTVLKDCAATFTNCEASPRLDSRSTVDPASEAARDLLMQASSSPLRGLRRARLGEDILRRVDELWRAVPVLDRATNTPLTANACHRLAPLFDDLAHAYCEDTRRLAQAIRAKAMDKPQPLDSVAHFAALGDALQDALTQGDLERRDHDATLVAHWAWRVIIEQTQALVRELGGEDAVGGDAAQDTAASR